AVAAVGAATTSPLLTLEEVYFGAHPTRPGGGRADEQERKGRSSLALQRLGALLLLGGLAFYFTAYKPSQVIHSCLFFGLGGVFAALSLVARAMEEKGK